MVARRQALAHGAARVVMIEGGVYGTTCARVGCMPSKLLIAAAERAEQVRSAGQFGVVVDEVEIDGEAVMRRVQRERDGFVGYVVESIERLPAEQKLRGWARLTGPNELVVEGPVDPSGLKGTVQVRAEAIIVAAGSSPLIPPPLRELGDRLLTSDSVFDLPRLPRSLAIVGNGVIGLELGQTMRRLGVETSVLDIGERMPLVRSDVMQAEAHRLFAHDLDLQLRIRDLVATRSDEGVRLRWHVGEEAREGQFEWVLAAAGRRPNLERLDLGKAGITLDERGRPLDWDPRTMQIADTPIFMAGDVTGDRPVLHEAAAEGRIAGINAARWPEVRAHVRFVPISIMFTDPQVAVVGEIPQAEGEGQRWEVGEVDFGDQGRARVMAEDRGRVRVYADACGQLLGAELICPRAEHMAHLLAWAIEQRLSVHRLLEMPYYHPVVEEGLRTAIADAASKLKLAGKLRPLDCGPGA